MPPESFEPVTAVTVVDVVLAIFAVRTCTEKRDVTPPPPRKVPTRIRS